MEKVDIWAGSHTEDMGTILREVTELRRSFEEAGTNTVGMQGGNSIALEKGLKISGPFSVPFSGALFVLLNQE